MAPRHHPDPAPAAVTDTVPPPPGTWCFDAPWDAVPRGIATARLSFSTDGLLASDEARRVPIPDALRHAVPRRRADHIAGRLCAQAALAHMAASRPIPPAALAIGRTEQGAPRWPNGFTGSISHAGGQAVAVAALARDYRSLGVDVEQLMTVRQAETLAPMILMPADRALTASYPPGFATTLIFSLKEALFKALHPLTGEMFFHEHAELVTLDPCGTATLRLLCSLGRAWQTGAMLPALWHCTGDHIFTLIFVDRA